MPGMDAPSKARAGRLTALYLGLFAALAAAGLVCWNWQIVRERWYVHQYERTGSAEYREKLEQLGERPPELPLSRWFAMVRGYDGQMKLEHIPVQVRRKCTGLYLREKLKGNWWEDEWQKPLTWPPFPPPLCRAEWEPHVEVLRDAVRRARKPPPTTGVAIYTFYDVCLALAYCGDESVLPYLEDNLFRKVGCFPYELDAIVDCAQGARGVVVLAAHGSRRARSDVTRALKDRTTRLGTANEIERILGQAADYLAANIAWLRARLGEFDAGRAAERAAARARCREVEADLRRVSCVAYRFHSTQRLGGLLFGRVVCRRGCAAVEKAEFSGKTWRFWRLPMALEDYEAFWRELLEVDPWRKPGRDQVPVPGGQALAEYRLGEALAVYRLGDDCRAAACSGAKFEYPVRWEDQPATWAYALVHDRLVARRPTGNGAFGGPGGIPVEVQEGWLRGEPWEELVKRAGSSAVKAPPAASAQAADPPAAQPASTPEAATP